MAYKEVGSWPLVKKYLACHYYLSEEKPARVTEAQRDQLGALHLYVTHGPHKEDNNLPELQRCTGAEKRRRIDEWKKLVFVNQQVAMQQFVAVVTSLFPSWHRYKKLHSEFEQEWTRVTPQLRQSPKRVARPVGWPHRPHRSHRPVLAERLARFRSPNCNLPSLHASRDARELLYSLHQRKCWRKQESVYYRHLPADSERSFAKLPRMDSVSLGVTPELPLGLHSTVQTGLKHMQETLELLRKELV